LFRSELKKVEMTASNFKYLRIVFSVYIAFFIGSIASIQAQILKPVTWEYYTEDLGNGEFNLVFKAEIDEGWTVYSQNTDDSGPVPTEITFEQSEHIEFIGDPVESGHRKEGYDKLFDVVVIKFLHDEPFVISQKVKIIGKSAMASGYLTYMTCDSEKCLPPTDVDFSFNLQSGEKKSKGGGGNQDQEGQALLKAEKSTEIIVNQDNLQEGDITPTMEVDIEISIDKEGAYNNLLSPVQWTFSAEKLDEKKYLLRYTADIQDGWTVYSKDTDDDGPVPTQITYEKQEGTKESSDFIETGHKKEGIDNFFDVNVIKFLSDQPFEITQEVEIDGTGGFISGYLTYMACNSEQCLPPTDIDFKYSLGDYVEPPLSKAEILEDRVNGQYIDQRITSIIETHKDPLSECEESAQVSSSLIWTFIFGFIGGLFALLTPCVFPMLPITVSYFMKDNKRSGLTNGLIYGASIIVIYVVLGLLITMLLGPDALNRLSTNWIANTAFFLIFIAFAFSFFGFYEITLPSSWTTKSDRMADKGGLIGIFFMAFTLALVSFSCTGPIIGTAIVQAASKGEYVGPFTVMLGFSTALALPFGLFAAFPSWLNSLPRSGSWMNSVKVVLGFLELALAFKFLSVADMTNHWGILKYELFMGLWVLIFLGMAAYLFGFIKFPHDSPIKKLSAPRKVFAVSVLALAFYLSSGFMIREETGSYCALPLMSGIAPPANYNYFLAEPLVDPLIKAKYPSYTKCANNIDCFKDYYDGLAYAKETNKPIMLDFTGYGCVNCRKTEEHIWVDNRISQALKEDLVLISLYVDDDAALDSILISEPTGQKLRNVGNKWSDFQVVNFQQNSQPLYVLATPHEEVISSPRPFKDGVEDYYKFLECGLNAYKKTKK
jgi:thiol:disulfide interchange protein DsbD